MPAAAVRRPSEPRRGHTLPAFGERGSALLPSGAKLPAAGARGGGEDGGDRGDEMGDEVGWGIRAVTARPPELREPQPRALSGCGNERSHSSPQATRAEPLAPVAPGPGEGL